MLKCRSCETSSLVSVIPLGPLPLANALLEKDHPRSDALYNLEVMLCEQCGLAQLRDLVDPAVLFSDYVYFSSHSEAMLTCAAQLVQNLVPNLNPDALVVEIASNDGYLLKNYVQAGINVLGVDPAQNIAKLANEKGIPTLAEFFNKELAQKLAEAGKQADIIHANNVMAHVPDINGFIKGIKTLLHQGGTTIIEVPYFLDLVNKLEFDTIYHEHVYYFSVSALKTAFERQGLEIVDIQKLDLHGGSLRLFVKHAGEKVPSPIVSAFLQEEEEFGLHQPALFQNFMSRLTHLKQALRTTLKDLKAEGAKIAAYGASAKGTTLLNYFGIDASDIHFVVDRSPVKQGKITPGTYLPIFAPDHLVKEKISHALLLTWNFAEEIMSQQKIFLEKGGKFIIPLPEVKIVA